MVLVILPDKHPDHIDFFGQIDWLGNFLVSAGVLLLLYVLSMAPGADKGWATPRKQCQYVDACFPASNLTTDAPRHDRPLDSVDSNLGGFRCMGMVDRETFSHTSFITFERFRARPWQSLHSVSYRGESVRGFRA